MAQAHGTLESTQFNAALLWRVAPESVRHTNHFDNGTVPSVTRCHQLPSASRQVTSPQNIEAAKSPRRKTLAMMGNASAN